MSVAGHQTLRVLNGSYVLDRGDLDAAACHAYVTRLITARPFLPGIEGEWAHAWRCRLEDHRIRAIECMAEEQLQRGQTTAAIRSAELVLELDSLRETAWQILIRSHTASGNPGSARLPALPPGPASAARHGTITWHPCRPGRTPGLTPGPGYRGTLSTPTGRAAVPKSPFGTRVRHRYSHQAASSCLAPGLAWASG